MVRWNATRCPMKFLHQCAMSKNPQISKKDIRNVKLWFASFILLAIDIVIFVICFLLEHLLWLYLVCIVILAVFATLYIRITAAITHKDGYTLIQAMHFYRVCRKAGIDAKYPSIEENDQLCRIAVQFDYSSRLTPKKVLCLYQTGDLLSAEIRSK